MYKIILLLAAIAAVVSAQDLTLINIIQFSDDYCLCPNEQHISVVDLCVPVIGGYSVYRLVDGTPDQVIIQTCSDNQCTQCTNTTTYDARPPCQTESDGISYYSVLPENDVTTYYNAPSVVTVRFPYKNCSGDALHVDIAYGLSCFPTETGSFYYECPAGVTTEYYVYNCSDNACLEECTATIFPTEQCTDDEGVFKSVYCTPSSATSTTQTATSQTATSQTATSNDNTATGQTMASATVSTTTSASSHNVSSSASAAGGTSASAGGTSGGSQVLFSDVRGGHMKRKAPRSNPPFCNGGVPSTSTSSDATAATSATSATAGTAGTAGTSGGSGGSSGGRGAKIFITKA